MSTGCWEWTGYKNTSGYGNIRWDGKTVFTHRLAAFFVGMLSSPFLTNLKGRLLILHECDNPACCNPRHFKLGTQKRNIRDCIKRGRRNYRNEDNMTTSQ